MAVEAAGNMISLLTGDTVSFPSGDRPPLVRFQVEPSAANNVFTLRSGTTAGSGTVIWSRTVTATTPLNEEMLLKIPSSGMNLTITGTTTTSRLYLYFREGNE